MDTKIYKLYRDLAIVIVVYVAIVVAAFALLDRFLREPGWFIGIILAIAMFFHMASRITKIVERCDLEQSHRESNSVA